MEIVTLPTPGLGDRSYVVSDGAAALVVDPQRDVDRVLAVLEARGLRLSHVLETHVHNDYVSGGLELARRTGADYGLAAAEDVAFPRLPLADGTRLEVGALEVEAVRTPGHTPEHLSYVVSEAARPVAVFTGGSLLYGTVGRTDLSGTALTGGLTRAQHASVRRLAARLPDDVTVHPTHGFGSFCASASGSGAQQSTIGQERGANLALQVDDGETFARTVLDGLSAYPRYYAHMAPRNRAGPAPVDLRPAPPLDPEEIRRRIAAGEWVVDLRQRRAFAAGHLAGTVNVERGDPFATWLAWTMPWGTPVTLVGDSAEEVAAAQRALARVGIDRPAGQATGGPPVYGGAAPLRRYRVADFPTLAAERDQGRRTVLDVRRDDEWAAGHLRGAVSVPLPDLPARLADLPAGELWVHCASGYRAAIAASLLDGAGHAVVLVDDAWDRAEDAGLEVVGG